MTLLQITSIISAHGRKATKISVVASLSTIAARLAEDSKYPPRKQLEYWSAILSACITIGVSGEGITALVAEYETLFPRSLLDLLGNIPYIVEGFRLLKLESPDKIKRPMAALCIVVIASMGG